MLSYIWLKHAIKFLNEVKDISSEVAPVSEPSLKNEGEHPDNMLSEEARQKII